MTPGSLVYFGGTAVFNSYREDGDTKFLFVTLVSIHKVHGNRFRGKFINRAAMIKWNLTHDIIVLNPLIGNDNLV